jgi:isopentenyl phosphate kinase
MTRPVFLKLGGALITDKAGREAARSEVIERLAAELADWRARSDAPLVLAHGSGSFAHVAVRETGLDRHPHDRLAAARVSAAARRLDAVVVEALLAAGLAAVPVPGAVLVERAGGEVRHVRADLVAGFLAAGWLPVLFGDLAPDRQGGAAIVSTEQLLVHLAAALPPARVVLATDVDGVYERDPARDPAARPIARLTPAGAARLAGGLGGGAPGTADVTGGMAGKVEAMLALVSARPELTVRVVGGQRPGAVAAALDGAPEAGGTLITADAAAAPPGS